MKRALLRCAGFCLAIHAGGPALAQSPGTDGPVHGSRPVFSLENTALSSLHNHGSSLVQAPDGGLLVSWFHGSGERKADDVLILGARLEPGASEWSEPFVLADTPGFPDTNCTMTVDPEGRLWLIWPTILDNRWEGALLKYKTASDWTGRGAPVWNRSDVIHMKPGDDFPAVVRRKTLEYAATLGLDPERPESWPEGSRQWYEHNLEQAADKLTRRLGWFTRAHPYWLGDRLLVGLYSDGFSFASATYSDDFGATWTMAEPIVGGGAVQPSFAQREDGTVVAFMRDNGPPPKRVLVAESEDRGESWSVARDHPDLVESGAGNEVLVLSSGRWIVLHNDTPQGRHRLAVSISEDEGRSFRLGRYLEKAEAEAGRFHYPSVIESRDGMLHATYSYHVRDEDGREHKTIQHTWFNESWLLQSADDSGEK